MKIGWFSDLFLEIGGLVSSVNIDYEQNKKNQSFKSSAVHDRALCGSQSQNPIM